MQNLMVAYQFRSDEAVIGGGRYLSNFPLTNLQQMPFAKRCISRGIDPEVDNTFHVYMDPQRQIRVMLLLKHGMSDSGQIRIQGTSTPAWTGVTVNGAHTAGDNTISMTKAGDAIINNGDIFKFANHDTLYKVVTGATFSVGSPTHTIAIEIDGQEDVGISENVGNGVAVTTLSGDYQETEYDSELHDVWPTIFPFGLLEWEDDNWWSGKLLPEDAIGYPINYWKILDGPTLLPYWKFNIYDQDNYSEFVDATDISFASGDNSINSVSTDLSIFAVGQSVIVEDTASNNKTFRVVTSTPTKLTVDRNTVVTESAGGDVQIKTGNITIGSRLVMAPVFQPELNMTVGSKLRYVPRTDARESRNGADYRKNRSNKREFSFAWDGLTKIEAFSGVADIQLRKGDFGDVVVIPDPEDDEHMHVRLIYGKMVEPKDIDNPFYGRYQHAMTVKETR